MLKLIAPFRALFNLDSSLIAANPRDFSLFLKLLRDDFGAPESAIRKKIHPSLSVEVNVPPDEHESEISCRYSAFNLNGSQYYLPNVLTVRFQEREAKIIERIYNEAAVLADRKVKEYSKFFFPDVESFRIDFQDNTIAILSLEMTVNHASLGKFDQVWSRLDDWTSSLVYYLLSALYKEYLLQFLMAVHEYSDESNYCFVLNPSHYTICRDVVEEIEEHPEIRKRFMLMWVNRTLCYGNNYPTNNWIKPLMRNHEVLKIKDAELHINTANSVVILPPGMDKKELQPLWEVMLAAQYYYAAMDVMNNNLVIYIGTTFNHKTSKTLRHLSEEMEEIVNSITILQVRYHDLAMEMQGLSRKILQILQKEWDFDVMVENVRKKLELCKANIAVLNQETNKRNQGRMEIVLTGLSGLSVISLCISLASYAMFASRLPPENRLMIGKVPGLLDLGFVFSGNALSWIGITIAVSIIFFSIINRRA